MSDHKDAFSELDDGDFPVPASAREPEVRRPKGDVFPDDEEEGSAPPRRAPLSRRASAAPAREETGADFGFGHEDDAEGLRDSADDEAEDHRQGQEHHASDDDEGSEGHEGGDHEGVDDEDGEHHDEGGGRSLPFGLDKGKLVMGGAALAVVAFVGWAGWGYVSSMFPSAPTQQVGALTQMGGAGSRPVQSGMPYQQARANGMPSMPSSSAPPSLPPSGMPRPVQATSATLPPAPARRPAVTDASYETRGDAPVGGDVADKGALDRMSEALAKVEARLDALATKTDVGNVAERLSRLDERVASVEERAVAPTTPRPSSEPPAKPQVISGWSLKGVAGGTAWLQGPAGLIEAKVGDQLPGAGVLKAIAKYEKDYVVMTTDGVIVRK